MTPDKELLKLFASMLCKCAKDETEALPKVDPSILNFLSRKDIISIVQDAYGGSIPGKPDLALLENQELLEYIPNDLFIISYVLHQWCLELLQKSDAVVKSKRGKEDTNED